VANVEIHAIGPGGGRALLLVVAHADDPALFLGGTLALWSRAGWRVIVVRVTDDRRDSVGLDEPRPPGGSPPSSRQRRGSSASPRSSS
jgi:LmbE family N-acetylglucosaminyl deacetylase